MSYFKIPTLNCQIETERSSSWRRIPDYTMSGEGSVLSSSEHGNEPSVVIKGMEFPDHVSDYQLPKYHSAPWCETVNMKKLSLE